MAFSARFLPLCRDQITGVRRPGLNAIVAATLIILTLTIWPAVYSSWAAHHDLGISWRALVFSSMFVGGALLWGLLPTSLVASARSIWDFPLVVVTGSSLLSAGLMLLSFLLPVAPWAALLFLFLSGGILAFVSARKIPDFFSPLHQISPSCLLAICVGLLAASAWSQSHLFAFEDAGQTVIYKPWVDSLRLARPTALFSDWVQPQTLGRLDLSGWPVSFYHYGSYAAAGTFSGITKTPSLSGINAFAIPWSAFLVALSAYALGKHWWGPRIGLASLAVAFLLPDASFYGLKNAWFGYYWLLQTSPAQSWGIALGACSILLIDAACRRAESGLFFLGLCLACLTLLFKAQIAAILVPPLLLWGVLFFPGIKIHNRVQILVYTGITLAFLTLAATHLSNAPTVALGQDWGSVYLNHIARGIDGEGAQNLWRQIVASKWLLPQVALVLIGSFGVLPLIWLAAIIIRWVRKQVTVSDFLPLFFLLMHLAVIFGLAANMKSNPWELHHRPFALIYFLFAVWCGGGMLTLLKKPGRAFARSRGWSLARQRHVGQQRPEKAFDESNSAIPQLPHVAKSHDRPRFTWQRPVVVLGLLSLLAFPLLLGNQILGERLWFPRPQQSIPLSKDLLACVDLIRQHAARTDVVQMSDNDVPWGITGGLIERATYLSPPTLQSRNVAYSSVAEARAADLNDLAMAETVQTFGSLITRLPIRWYFLKPDSEVSWPDDVVSKPAFQCGAYKLYDLDRWRQ